MKTLQVSTLTDQMNAASAAGNLKLYISIRNQIEAITGEKVFVENERNGFLTVESAHEYAVKKLEWWGSNLVYLGINEENGLFFPSWNVWD